MNLNEFLIEQLLLTEAIDSTDLEKYFQGKELQIIGVIKRRRLDITVGLQTYRIYLGEGFVSGLLSVMSPPKTLGTDGKPLYSETLKDDGGEDEFMEFIRDLAEALNKYSQESGGKGNIRGFSGYVNRTNERLYSRINWPKTLAA
jgi:hypothetical protein